MRHDGGRHLVLTGRKAAFVAEESEQRHEPEASRASLVSQQSLIARLQRPLGCQFIVVPKALHRVLPVANYRVVGVKLAMVQIDDRTRQTRVCAATAPR